MHALQHTDSTYSTRNSSRPERSHTHTHTQPLTLSSLSSLSYPHNTQVSGMLQLLNDLDGWCDDLPIPSPQPPQQQPAAAVPPPPPPAAEPPPPPTTQPKAEEKGGAAANGHAVRNGGHQNNGSGGGEAAKHNGGGGEAAKLSLTGEEAIGAAAATAAFPPPSETSHDVDDNKARRFSPNTTTNNGNAPPPPPPQPKPKPRSEARSRLESYAQGLACTYLHAETSYLECAVRVAAELAEVDAESRTLSLVDDAFFVLLKVFSRGVATGHALLAVIPLLNAIVECLRDVCIPILQKRLRSTGAAEPSNERFLIAVNSMQLAEEYTTKLRLHVQTSFQQQYASMLAMVDTSLSDLEGLTTQCHELAERAISRLVHELLPFTWVQIDFEPTSFVIKDEGQEAEAQRSFEFGLLRPLTASVQPLIEKLRGPNVELLVHTLAARLAELLEESLLSKRFNELGAMLMQEHTRKLIDTLSELLDTGTVRNEFGRLNQIAFLLNAGSVQEAMSLLLSSLGGGAAEQQPGGTVRLTRAQAAKVLCLRSDLSLKDELSDFLIDEEEEVASEAKPV